MSIVILNDLYTENNLSDFVFEKYFITYPIKKLNEAKPFDKNFMYIFYRPAEFDSVISDQSKDFFKQIKDKDINILIYLEGFDLFNIPEIFEKKLEIWNVEYWKIVKFFSFHGIDESRLYFISSAHGYENDIKLLKQRKIIWLDEIKPIKAKFCSLNTFLIWGSQQKNIQVKDKFFEKIYASLSNGRPSVHRYEFTKKLWHQDLIKDGLVSMCQMTNGDPAFESHLPIILDNKHNLWSKNENENHIFQKSFLWVSNETHMENKLTLFSEKTIRAIIYMIPFVINGDIGTLEYLKILGFKTFGDFWDESYDLTENIEERQDKIIGIIKDLKNKNLQKLYNQMRPILEHNRDLLFNKNWLDTLHTFLHS